MKQKLNFTSIHRKPSVQKYWMPLVYECAYMSAHLSGIMSVVNLETGTDEKNSWLCLDIFVSKYSYLTKVFKTQSLYQNANVYTENNVHVDVILFTDRKIVKLWFKKEKLKELCNP